MPRTSSFSVRDILDLPQVKTGAGGGGSSTETPVAAAAASPTAAAAAATTSLPPAPGTDLYLAQSKYFVI